MTVLVGQSKLEDGHDSDDPEDDLDQGFWAWIVVLGSFLTNGIIFGVINCYGILFKQIESNFAAGHENAKFLTCKSLFDTRQNVT